MTDHVYLLPKDLRDRLIVQLLGREDTLRAKSVTLSSHKREYYKALANKFRQMREQLKSLESVEVLE